MADCFLYLQDILENDNIHLDDKFIASLVCDLLKIRTPTLLSWPWVNNSM